MIVVTGATGRTGRAAIEALLAKGQKVRAFGRDAKKLAPLVEHGAEPYLGNVENVDSLTKAFNGASVVYLVLPEDISQQDLRAHQERVSDSYAAAITNAHVRFVVNLSSIGAQHAKNRAPSSAYIIRKRSSIESLGSTSSICAPLILWKIFL